MVRVLLVIAIIVIPALWVQQSNVQDEVSAQSVLELKNIEALTNSESSDTQHYWCC